VEKDMTSKNSTSLLRKPAAKEDFVRGRTGQFPFSPGGLEGMGENDSRFTVNEKTTFGPLLSIPPGFTRGLRAKTEEDLDIDTTEAEEEETTELVESVLFTKTAAPKQRNKESLPQYESIDDLLSEEVSNRKSA
jgi:antiviral helicase SKI2